MKEKLAPFLILAAAIVVGGFFLYSNNSNSSQANISDANDFLAREKSQTSEESPVGPSVTGTIEPSSCDSAGDWQKMFACYDTYYQKLVKDIGPKEAMVDLKIRYNQEPFVKNECHQLAHVIGRAATAKYPTVDEAYIRGDSACWSGYYHGVIEAVMASIGTSNITFETLNTICKGLAERERYSFDHYNCVHGIGHGLMYIHENELFVALENCDKISDSWERSSCWGGVFMENIIADNKNHFTKYLKPEEPLYPCSATTAEQKYTCYLMQTSYMLKVKGGNFAEVFRLCGTVGEEYINTCYQSLGRDASGQSISDPVRTKASCMLGPDERAQSNCVIGAVKDFISYHHSDVQANAFCESLAPNLKQTCLDTGAAYYKSF